MPTRFNREDIAELIGELKKYLDREFWQRLEIEGKKLPQETFHPWSRGYWKFLRLRREEKMPMETAKMGMEMLALMEFKNYWTKQNIINPFIGRLRNPQESKGLLFELRVAYHFRDHGCDVQLLSVPESSQSICDMVVSKGHEKLEVECSRKQYRADRTSFHLANYLHKEAPQLSGRNPGIIAIHVPEHIDWIKLNRAKELEKSVKSEFRKTVFRCVTMVVFSCDHKPETYHDEIYGLTYNMSIRNYKIRNSDTVVEPPSWFS